LPDEREVGARAGGDCIVNRRAHLLSRCHMPRWRRLLYSMSHSPWHLYSTQLQYHHVLSSCKVNLRLKFSCTFNVRLFPYGMGGWVSAEYDTCPLPPTGYPPSLYVVHLGCCMEITSTATVLLKEHRIYLLTKNKYILIIYIYLRSCWNVCGPSPPWVRMCL
jgi:hypothetical protein